MNKEIDTLCDAQDAVNEALDALTDAEKAATIGAGFALHIKARQAEMYLNAALIKCRELSLIGQEMADKKRETVEI